MAEDTGHVLTRTGYERLKEELDHLRTVRRAEVTERLRAAREEGEGEESEYNLAREDQAFVEGRIAALERLMAEAEVMEEPSPAGQPEVGIGYSVVVRDEDGAEETYYIVGPMEADPDSGRISTHSPVGQALVGHRAGDSVEVETPMGTRRLSIVGVSWG